MQGAVSWPAAQQPELHGCLSKLLPEQQQIKLPQKGRSSSIGCQVV